MIVKLTQSNQQPIYVNTDLVMRFQAYDSPPLRTQLDLLNDHYVYVWETCGEVHRLMNAALAERKDSR